MTNGNKNGKISARLDDKTMEMLEDIMAQEGLKDKSKTITHIIRSHTQIPTDIRDYIREAVADGEFQSDAEAMRYLLRNGYNAEIEHKLMLQKQSRQY